jgi:hypothetical protein
MMPIQFYLQDANYYNSIVKDQFQQPDSLALSGEGRGKGAASRRKQLPHRQPTAKLPSVSRGRICFSSR